MFWQPSRVLFFKFYFSDFLPLYFKEKLIKFESMDQHFSFTEEETKVQLRISAPISWPSPASPSTAHCSAWRGRGMLCLPSQGPHCILGRMTYLISIMINVVSEA